MSEEKPAGLIPRIIVRNALVTREYAVLVTDKRSIFVLHSTGRDQRSGQSSTSPGTLDYEREDPELLATDPKNFVIPHADLEKIEVKRESPGSPYRFNVEYKSQEGKTRRVKGHLAPPLEQSGKKATGNEGEPNLDYARKAREVYQRALPPIASEALTEWDL